MGWSYIHSVWIYPHAPLEMRMFNDSNDLARVVRTRIATLPRVRERAEGGGLPHPSAQLVSESY